LITARDLLGLKTKIIGVVSVKAQTAKLSFDQKKLIETKSANTFADGMAVRVPIDDAYDIYSKGAEKIITVSDDEIANAIRLYYSMTHNIAEGAGAASLAAAIKEKDDLKDKNIAVILTGGNIDKALFSQVLQGETPRVG
jgi:threonine dehydratase